MGYVKVTDAKHLNPGSMEKFQIGQRTILLANAGGALYALDNKCPHMGGDLSKGKLDGTTVMCPRHGAAFDVTTGRNIAGAKIAFVGMKVGDAAAFPVKVEGDDVLVDLP